LTHDQRTVLFASVLVTLSAIGLMYYTTMQLLIAPLVVALNYFVLSNILVSRNRSHILAKLIKPSLWLIILYSYIYSIHAIFLIPIFWFTIFNIFVALGYGIMILQEANAKPKIIVDNALSITLMIFSMSLASLMLAYWHWPTVLVMLGVWLVLFFISLSWLLDFTDKPYLIASVWALISIEIFWICSRWINLYHVPQTSLLVSQSALVLSALAYGFGGLYYHFKNHTLKRSLLFEYISVTTVVFAALMLLSKWAVAI